MSEEIRETETLISKAFRILKSPYFLAGTGFTLLAIVMFIGLPLLLGPLGVPIAIVLGTMFQGLGIVFYVMTARQMASILRRRRVLKYWSSR